MKKNSFLAIITLAFFALFSNTYAQSVYDDSDINNYISKRSIDVNLEANYTGTPYLNKEFQNGTIYKNGITLAHNVGIRYNASKDLFEIKKTSVLKDDQAKVLKTTNDLTIKLNNKKFIYLSPTEGNSAQGYFIMVSKGEKASVLKKAKKMYIPGQKAYNSLASPIAANYKEKITLYLYTSEGKLIEFPKSKKGKINAFQKHSKELKIYTKENKLNLNKEAGLIKLCKYYNSL
ncbi:MAG: hypothetical protein L3J08_01520 [Flavobacteriaceae bacterium]|nr:hypothetical protein [Flavobacteriaceae bacterium]